MTKVILLVDDQPQIRKDLGARLEKNGYAVFRAEQIEDAKKLILSENIDYGIIDLKLDFRSDYGGIDIVRALKRHQPKAKTIVLSGYGPGDLSLDDEVSSQVDHFVSKKEAGNYILTILDVLSDLDRAVVKRDCFVIMPFSTTTTCSTDEWVEVFDQVVRPGVEGSGFGFECRRSNPVQGSIIEDILDNLNRADLVVADLTDKNPNVFYELGVRHTLRDATILISQRIDDIPFDLRHYAILTYEWKRVATREEFKSRMKKVIATIVADPQRGASPIRKYLRL